MDKCEKYSAWGCEHVFVLNPATRIIHEWVAGSLLLRHELDGIPASKLWAELDRDLQKLAGI